MKKAHITLGKLWIARNFVQTKGASEKPMKNSLSLEKATCQGEKPF
jgi:hypothetical protein